MNDLISRQAAIAEIKKCRFVVDAIEKIRGLPAAEVEPVKHGRWEEKAVSNCRIDEWQSARCSVCGRYHTTPYMYYFTGFKYCPNCGAVMEER